MGGIFMSSFNLSEILQYIPEDDTLDADAICEFMKEKKERTELLSQHPYQVWQSKKDGRWYTRFHDEVNGNIQKSRKTKPDLEDLIVAYYRQEENRPCFPEVYEEWIAEKKEFGEIAASSLCRYRSDFKRFFPADHPFCKIKLYKMNASYLERFIKGTISELKLTRKAYAGLRTLLMGVFKFAKREGYTDFSISTFFSDLLLPKNIFVHNIKNSETEVFSIEEIEKLITYLWNNQTQRDLAILLQIYTGLRVGELTALKPEDNYEVLHLRIARTEYNYYDTELGKRVSKVKEFPKTENSVRKIILPKKAQDIINRLKLQVGSHEYLFCENGKRITSKMINYHLHKVCEKVGIPPRSTHKIRRSYGSKLLMAQVDDTLVQGQMGHGDVATTQKYYYFDIEEDKNKLKIINDALDF